MPWHLDKGHSQIEWGVAYIGGLNLLKGFFSEFEADVNMESSDVSEWSIAAVVQVKSVYSADKKREEVVMDADILDVEQFPTMTFRSTHLVQQGEIITMAGDLTMRGVTREVIFAGKDNGDLVDFRGIHRRGFSALGTIKRSDFGIGSKISVGQEVRLSLEIQLIEGPS